VGILAVIVTGVLVTVNRSVEAMVDNRSRVMAFELARENMERLLGSDSVTDMTEFGVHELDEDIQWQNVVESFNEPVKSKMWIRAICSASYTDRNGERQTIELIHWITDVTKAQEKQILDQKRREQEFLEEQGGNPFGDDPDGLMQYANALIEIGDYAKAIDVLSEIPFNYPDSPAVTPALRKIPRVVQELAGIDPDAAREIIPELVGNFPDVTEIQKLPDEVEKWALMPGRTLRGGSAGSGSGSGSGAGGSGGETLPGSGSGGSTGSGNEPRYPNPNWSDEQKKLYDMLREKLGL
jgi:uncharacterized membrane protein YgcG